MLRRADHDLIRSRFWKRQGVSLLSTAVLILGLLHGALRDSGLASGRLALIAR